MTFVKGGLAAALLCAVAAVGCKSSYNDDVKSTYRSQSVMVMADVEATSAAAKQVFEENQLKNISAEMDKIKGEVSGDMADKTKVYASVRKEKDGSKLTVQVGRGIGDPEVGANMATKIKQIAEKKPM